MVEFVRFFTYVLLVVVACITVYCGVKFIEYSWNVIVSKTPPFVPANSIERAAVANQINVFYPRAKTVLELGSGYGGLADISRVIPMRVLSGLKECRPRH